MISLVSINCKIITNWSTTINLLKPSWKFWHAINTPTYGLKWEVPCFPSHSNIGCLEIILCCAFGSLKIMVSLPFVSSCVAFLPSIHLSLHPSLTPPLSVHPGVHQDFLKPAERFSLSSKSWVFPGPLSGKTSLEYPTCPGGILVRYSNYPDSSGSTLSPSWTTEWIPNLISQRERIHSSKETNFCRLYLKTHSFGH